MQRTVTVPEKMADTCAKIFSLVLSAPLEITYCVLLSADPEKGDYLLNILDIDGLGKPF